MNKFSMKKLLSILLCIALIAALALSTVGCSKNDKTEPVASAEASGGTVSMGEGETMFLFNVVDPEGKESHFEIHTDEKTVGAALLSLGLIAGEDDVLQSQNHLEAIGKRKRSDRRRLRRAVSAAHGTGILDGVPVSEGKTESIMFGSHHTKT